MRSIMTKLPLGALLVGALSVVFTMTATAAGPPAALPGVERVVHADATTARACPSAGLRPARGVALSSYRAPMSGFVSVRLVGAGDWDLSVADAASRRRLGSSQGFGGREIVQTWVAAGQRLTVLACRRSAAARSARVSVGLLDVAPPAATGTPSLVRVSARPRQLETLESLGFDVTHERGLGWADVVVVGAGELAELERLGLEAQTRIADLPAHERRSRAADARYAARAANGSPLPSGRTTYRSYDEIQGELKQLVADHPDRVRPVVIGRSHQGRELSGIEIADGVRRSGDGRPVHLVLATHHAREWPSAEVAMEYATLLANARRGDTRLARLLGGVRTVVVPLVNPDAFIATKNAEPIDPYDNTRTPETDNQDNPLHLAEVVAPPGGILSYRRKNCAGDLPSPDVPCELQWGIDPNRNYGQHWGGAGSSPDVTSQAYHGPGPFSEPETQAVRDWTRTHQVTSLMTLHNVAALVLRPPGAQEQGLAPDEPRLKQFGDAMAAAAGYTSQYGFQLYDTTGTTEDYTYAAQGGYGYTIEIGPPDGTFHMPYEIGVVKQWTGEGGHGAQPGKGLREAMLIGGEAAASPVDHAILTGRAPRGAKLRLRRDFHTETSEYCRRGLDPLVISGMLGGALCAPGQEGGPDQVPDFVDSALSVPRVGRYTWHTNPSTRPFVGGGAKRFVVDEQASKVERFEGRAGDTSGGSSKDHPFALDGTDGLVKIALTWPVRAEDYDLEVFRCEGACDGAPDRPQDDPADTQVASSGNPPGVDEELSLDKQTATAGSYYVRVVSFLAATSQYEGSIAHFAGRTETTPGHPEAYTMTCTRGRLRGSRNLFAARGQRVTASFDRRCRPVRR